MSLTVFIDDTCPRCRKPVKLTLIEHGRPGTKPLGWLLFDSMCLKGIRESDWPRDRFAANIAYLPKLLKR